MCLLNITYILLYPHNFWRKMLQIRYALNTILWSNTVTPKWKIFKWHFSIVYMTSYIFFSVDWRSVLFMPFVKNQVLNNLFSRQHYSFLKRMQHCLHTISRFVFNTDTFFVKSHLLLWVMKMFLLPKCFQVISLNNCSTEKNTQL